MSSRENQLRWHSTTVLTLLLSVAVAASNDRPNSKLAQAWIDWENRTGWMEE